MPEKSKPEISTASEKKNKENHASINSEETQWKSEKGFWWKATTTRALRGKIRRMKSLNVDNPWEEKAVGWKHITPVY